MKKMLFTLVSILTIAVSANAMSYEQARNEALFLTDKMAYELNLNDAQYEAVYEINLDYLMGVTSYDNVYGPYWERRNLDLSYILYQWQWDMFRAASYFYRPLYWDAGHWHFGVYIHYPRRDYFYFGRPHFYTTYCGGHSWRHNGGRSWYEGRHHNYRTVATRDHHVGMRNNWDRGDYRNNGRSSTRITEREYNMDRGSNMDKNGRFDRNNNRNSNRNLDNNRNTNDNRSLNNNRNMNGNQDLSRNRSTTSDNRDYGSRRSNGSFSHGTPGNNISRGSSSGSVSRGSSSGSFSRGSSNQGSRSSSNSGSSHSGGRR